MRMILGLCRMVNIIITAGRIRAVCVAYCETLADVATACNRAHVVWRPEQGTAYSQELWAPELHYIDGAWYIYVAADDGNNANHRMYVLKSTSGDPTKAFEFVGKISDSTDKWLLTARFFLITMNCILFGLVGKGIQTFVRIFISPT